LYNIQHEKGDLNLLKYMITKYCLNLVVKSSLNIQIFSVFE